MTLIPHHSIPLEVAVFGLLAALYLALFALCWIADGLGALAAWLRTPQRRTKKNFP